MTQIFKDYFEFLKREDKTINGVSKEFAELNPSWVITNKNENSMTQEEIKNECAALYWKIRDCNQRLYELRQICTHPNTFEGNYSCRIGAYQQAIICHDCGKVVETKFPSFLLHEDTQGDKPETK